MLVAPGVLWMRMPLFAALPWINVWAIAEPEGWAVVDTGIDSAPTREAWAAAFAGAMGGTPVSRVLVTHMHPDHCGLAGWLTARFKVRLWMSRLEYLTCRLMAADTQRAAPAEALDFYRACGWDAAAIDRYREKFGAFGAMIAPLPEAFRRLHDGETLRIGAHEWEVVVGNGHSPEHACLYCPSLKLLIAGDQVLPKISSNVSVYPMEPDADPLADWQNSIVALKRRIPDDVLVLPAHNSPFHGLHRRLDQLATSHERALERLQEALRQPRRVVDVFEALFSRPIGAGLLGMATGEAMAHLVRLERTGDAVRTCDGAGVWWWRRPTGA